jgi:hypothetical protein
MIAAGIIAVCLNGVYALGGFASGKESSFRAKPVVLSIVNINSDGSTEKKIKMPVNIPGIDISFKIKADYYTEQVKFDWALNSKVLLRGNLKGIYNKPKSVPLSAYRKWTK